MKRARQPTPIPEKTCPICGTTFNRGRRAGGLMEHLSEYAKRQTCGPSCGAKLARATNTKPDQPAPCVTCGGSIPKRDGEPSHAWRARRTCSTDCLRENRAASARQAALRNTRYTPEERAERDRARKRKPHAVAPAPARRVAFDRFPEPAGVRPRWQAVVGEALPPHEWHNAGPSATARPDNLAAALHAHPDLATALAGLLRDSWVPFARGNGVRMHADTP